MASPNPRTETDRAPGPIPAPTTGAPRWVKVFGAVVLGLAVLLVGLKLAGIGPEHGPGRHRGAGQGTPSSGATRGGRTPPPAPNAGGDRP